MLGSGYFQKTVNFITVRGFKMAHAATQWSPPTAEQVGLIGPIGAKGGLLRIT